MVNDKIYDAQAPLPYSLRVSFERDGERILGYIVAASLIDGAYYYDVLDSEDTLEHGTLYEQVHEDEIQEEELWSNKELPYTPEKRWNPDMPWYQPDVRCCDCNEWTNTRVTTKLGDGRHRCVICERQYLRDCFWTHKSSTEE